LDRLESRSREELIQVILDQHRMIEQLRAEIEQLKRRGGPAPFSKGTRKTDPRPPGRKPGQGFFRFRGAAEAAEAETTVVLVEAGSCWHCGGALGEVREEIVTTTDVPLPPHPEVRRYVVQVRPCGNCGRSTRGQHPGIAPGQHGATAHRVGPHAKALAHILHYQHGVPVRKTPALIEDLTGLRLTPGAITQDAMRQSEGGVGAPYEPLRAAVPAQPVVHTDDTGWRVGGQTAFLMAFVNEALSVYQIRPRHRNEEVRELIPEDFAGVMVCDRGQSYDAEKLERILQQKCLGHLIRNAAEVAKQKTGRAQHFSSHRKYLLQQALALGAGRAEISPRSYSKRVRLLDQELTVPLRNRLLTDPDNQRLRDGAGLQHDLGRLLRFLYEDGIEPTNNRAERDLRPAVMARKVSHCSKNARGAHAFAAFTSILQTMRKKTPSQLVPLLTNLIRSPAPLTG
jgi:transposase